MLKEQIQDAINDQINAELYSSYIYLAMAAYFESINLPGFAKWMELQAVEENLHAMRFYKYVNDRGGRVWFKAVETPRGDWDGPADVFQNTLDHERYVSERIHKLVDLAREERDHPTENMLQWFVSEQIEEEANAEAILAQLQRMGDAKAALFMLDRELGVRVMPTATAAGAGA
jgi:ferritin